MRIALVSSNSFHYPGGIQNHIMGLYKYLKKRGHYVKIISPKYDSEERLCDDVIFFGKAKKFQRQLVRLVHNWQGVQSRRNSKGKF
jgi:glycosyltransferase involved in cell wall biosynthesis